jgi:hypothetical protein
MSNRSTEQTVCDRRILKAFYTQYVAVLLIMLVFSVGAFQRTSAQVVNVAPRVPVIAEHPSIGHLEFVVEFDSTGALVRTSDHLDAIAEVIKEHDVRAIVTLPVPNTTDESELVEVEKVMARLDALRGYLGSRGLSESDTRFYVGGPEARPGKVAVRFEEVAYDNLAL